MFSLIALNFKKEVFPILTLNSPLTDVNKIGIKRAELYKKLGIVTVGDLLHHFPRSYIDFTSAAPIDNAKIGDTVTVEAKVCEKYTPLRVRGGMTIFRLLVLDSSQNAITVTFFNNKFAYQELKTGNTYIFYGKLSGTPFQPELSVPIFVPKSQNAFMQPNYPLTSGLSHKMIANNIKEALLHLDDGPAICLPQEIMEKEGFDGSKKAFYDIHFPNKSVDAGNARKAFILEELICLQLGMSGLKQKGKRPACLVLKDTELGDFLSSLPFSPTSAQSRAIETAIKDMQSGKSMSRLLQGDVGSGKTLVAAALFYLICKNGGQCAFMAPTEILASQHYKTISRMLSRFGISVALLTGSTKLSQKRSLLSDISEGKLQVVCGTHALIEKNVEFNNLSLVVADEQHRFGVSQRAALVSKGRYPHTLIMSATPIPRSLALTIYGDLDISLLDELPSGRKQIETYLIDSKKRERAFAFIEKALENGNQAYIVCPAVEQSELEINSAIEYHAKLKEVFKNRSVGLLHGRIKGSEKDAIMADFASGNTDILVSTTVIEVGVDVSNATIMMIENAERFGLSQLHQLRGRVGRGKNQSYCILVSDSSSDTAKERLKIMCKTANGFEISRYDLKERGPGDFFGDRQHGLPPLQTADLISDSHLLEKAQNYAAEILQDDPQLTKEKNLLLKQKVNSLFKKLDHSRNN